MRSVVRFALAGLTICWTVGCAKPPRGAPQQPTPELSITPIAFEAPAGLTEPTHDAELSADVAPPVGWQLQQKSESDRHDHETWVSPTGRTAYGVVFFRTPLPVGPDLALRYGFLPNMRKAEGEATLLSKEYDRSVGGLRFVVEGGLYKVRSTMFTRGTRGWAVYAGTLRKEAVDEAELALAEAARERTRINVRKPTTRTTKPARG